VQLPTYFDEVSEILLQVGSTKPRQPTLPKSLDEAILQLKALEGVCYDLRDRENNFRCAWIRAKFYMGRIIDHQLTKSKDKEDVVQTLVMATGYSRTEVYRMRGVYLYYDKSSTEFEKFLSKQLAEGKTPSWAHVLNKVSKNGTDTKSQFLVEGERLERRSQKLDEDLENYSKKLNTVTGEARVEGAVYLGAAKAIVQDIPGALERAKESAEKIAIPRDNNYLAFVRTQPCCVTGMEGDDIQAHHFVTGGSGIKGSDYATVPIKAVYHRKAHDLGPKELDAVFEIDVWKVSANLLSMYFTGTRLS
jgi:hypothetical protein